MQKDKKGMERKFKCSKCGKSFAMEWARNNHEKLCVKRNKWKK